MVKLRLGVMCLLLAAAFGCGSRSDDIPVVKGPQEAVKGDPRGLQVSPRQQASQMDK